MKQNLPPGMEHFYRYATFSTSQDVCQSPLRALQRDISFSPRGSANGDGEIRPIYANQLQQLECLIRTQRDFQKLMKTNYTSLLDKYKNAMSEIELLRKQVTAVNLNRLAQEKTILERKFHEQIRARMVLENRFRTLLQALRAKCSALEKSQKKLLTCEQERNVFKAELEQLKQKNSVLEQRLTDALANQQSSLSHESFNDDEDSTRHSTYYSHNGLIPRKVTIQRSYEALKILLNLLVHNSMPSMVSKGLPFGSRCPMQLGTVRLEPKTTWDQLDARVGTILSSFAHKIAEATDGNRFSNVLRSINGTDSLLVSQTCNGQPKLDQSVWKSNVRFELGELQWFMGSPPTHNLLSIYNLQFCSTPFDLCMGLRSSSSSLKTNSSDRSTTEEAQSQLRQEIVLTLDSITEVSMQSGVSTAYLRKYLDAVSLCPVIVLMQV
ncbi:unnamed protein product [Echinostoma caproni]|uniref:CortBP2 domain-containing protein n=1 Tax=Echinostoma caproni TaxID=27848 RepID=A0A183A8Q0_9TREM|nr:unnamed protein product [Echinostoma caproni]